MLVNHSKAAESSADNILPHDIKYSIYVILDFSCLYRFRVRIMDGADEWVGKAEKGVEEKEERNV